MINFHPEIEEDKIEINTQLIGSSAFISKVLSLELHSYLLTCNTKNNQMSGLSISTDEDMATVLS